MEEVYLLLKAMLCQRNNRDADKQILLLVLNALVKEDLKKSSIKIMDCSLWSYNRNKTEPKMIIKWKIPRVQTFKKKDSPNQSRERCISTQNIGCEDSL